MIKLFLYFNEGEGSICASDNDSNPALGFLLKTTNKVTALVYPNNTCDLENDTANMDVFGVHVDDRRECESQLNSAIDHIKNAYLGFKCEKFD